VKSILSRYRVRNTLVAGGLAVVGALLVVAYVSSYRNSVTRGAGLVAVYVAARDIPEGTAGATATGGGYLKRETVLRRNIVSGAISNPSQIADLAAAQTIFAGEQLTVKQFHSLAQQGTLAEISGNLRAITIPGNNSQVLAGVVKTGNRVDVLANLKYSVKGGQPESVTRIILRNLLVLTAPSNNTNTGIGAGGTANSITLAVTDAQASKLFFATQNESWSLMLRPVARPVDTGAVSTTIQGLVGGGLSSQQVSQLTSGQGLGSVTNGG
jgi:Flp pilus assembly protein CpaB